MDSCETAEFCCEHCRGAAAHQSRAQTCTPPARQACAVQAHLPAFDASFSSVQHVLLDISVLGSKRLRVERPSLGEASCGRHQHFSRDGFCCTETPCVQTSSTVSAQQTRFPFVGASQWHTVLALQRPPGSPTAASPTTPTKQSAVSPQHSPVTFPPSRWLALYLGVLLAGGSQAVWYGQIPTSSLSREVSGVQHRTRPDAAMIRRTARAFR